MNALCAIILPCVGLNDYVLEALRGCLAQAYGRFQLVLLPDSPIRLPGDLEEDGRIHTVVTGEVTIGAKRNLGIRSVPNADYFALIDSDAYPESNWLKNGVSYLVRSQDVWAVGGPNVGPPGEDAAQRIAGNAKKSFLVSGPLHFAKKISPSRYTAYLHSCNLILPRVVFDTIGGFDESLFSGEDRNLCDRIRAAGKQIYFKKDVVVFHHNRRVWRPFLNQCFVYGHGSVDINRKGTGRRNLLLFLPVIWAGIFLTLVLLSFTGIGKWAPLVFAGVGVGTAVVEAGRCSERLGEIVPTLAAILACYAVTTAGQLTAILGFRVNLKHIYTSHIVDTGGRSR